MKRHAPHPTPPQPPKAPVSIVPWRSSTKMLQRLSILLLAAIPLLAALLQVELLAKLGERALCYADWEGFWETASAPIPGGTLAWSSAFLGTLFHVTGLGLTCTLLLGVATTLLARRWCQFSWAVALVPCIQVALQVTYCGFSVWIFNNPTFPQTYLLAWCAFLFAFGAVKRYGAWGLLTAALYPVTGISVLFGLLGATCLKHQRLTTRLFCALGPIAIVIGWKMCCYADPAWPTLLKTHTWFLFEEASHWWDCFTTLACLLICAHEYLADLWEKIARPRLKQTLCLVAPLLLCGTFYLACDPSDVLYSILRCERNLREGNGLFALTLPEKQIVQHRMLSAYYIHGCWRAGKLEDKLFDMPWRVSHKSSTIDTMSLDGHWMLYHYGIAQLARRWCYESVIKGGWNGDHYALLAKIALVCNELPLAQRYARQLARIPLRGKEAAELLAYATGANVPQNHELRRVAELHLRLCADSGSPIFEAGKRLEEGIYNRYAVLKNGNRDMVALYLCSSLLLQDTTSLTENFDVILSVWPQRPLPRVFQQGLLAAAATLPPAQQPRLTADLFTPGMFEAFQRFQAEAPTADPSDETFRKRFGKTYWYYATFVQ